MRLSGLRITGERQMSDMRDCRLADPNAELPFEHEHHGSWVQMKLVATAEVTKDGWLRRVATYACPSCGYELSESTPERGVDSISA